MPSRKRHIGTTTPGTNMARARRCYCLASPLLLLSSIRGNEFLSVSAAFILAARSRPRRPAYLWWTMASIFALPHSALSRKGRLDHQLYLVMEVNLQLKG